jgi:hypothetical protein|eukprot:CAMPEP_0174350910 /NCGR_PEP_ID=MMETSP0811_2-20130205/8117_1 /TAXON_ID=73025 ORGANISM="Eutreptiella gymnastica-like, Strain CCMP1594" /NCGR_SAMPLE_ID=MMETSP0811_2 /ASSEMBLY_ACC=CAM_ASM_000667 /LENGTH=120 /DNA_ID=CAMNT_0015479655 /DNA_START=1208 /DNA_END=1570 /DNA_ORIENTATION=-
MKTTNRLPSTNGKGNQEKGTGGKSSSIMLDFLENKTSNKNGPDLAAILKQDTMAASPVTNLCIRVVAPNRCRGNQQAHPSTLAWTGSQGGHHKGVSREDKGLSPGMEGPSRQPARPIPGA